MEPVEIIPFKKEHAIEIKVRKHEDDLKRNQLYETWAEMNELQGPAFTGLYEGKIVGCAGIRVLWPGVGEAWAIFSPEIVNLKQEAYHYVLKFLSQIVDDWKLHRVQAQARTDFPLASKYLEGLGFVFEGLMRKYYDDGSDAYLFALVR